jgi:tetratricopeptide (TPR) repeat protein
VEFQPLLFLNEANGRISPLSCSQPCFSQMDIKAIHERMGDSIEKFLDKTKLIAYFEEELKKYPQDEDVLRALALGYLEEKKFSLVIEYEQRALKVNPACAHCIRNMGTAYANIPGAGNKEKAIECLNKAIGLDPTDSYSWYVLGELKQSMGNNFGALSDFNKAIALKSDQADYYLDRSNLNLAQGFFSLALDDMNKVVQFAVPQAMPKALQLRSNLFAHGKLFPEALLDINKAIAMDSLNAGLYLDRGALYEGMNLEAKAKEDYLRSTQLNPDLYRAWYNLSRQSYKSEEMDEVCFYNNLCLAALRKSDPENPMVKYMELELADVCDSSNVNYFFHRSVAAINRKNYNESIDLCNATLRRFPGNGISYATRGEAWFLLHNYKQALLDGQAAMKANHEYEFPIMRRKADFQHFSDDSLRILIKAMGAGYHVDVAVAEYALGMDKLVLPEIDTAMQLMISGMGMTDLIYSLRGQFLLGAGRAEDAFLDFEKAIKLKPNLSSYYAERALCRLCMNGDIRLSHAPVFKESLVSPVVLLWCVPPNPVIRNPDFVLHSAQQDCNQALEIDPSNAFSWYISAVIKKLLGDKEYCVDWKKAKDLGYPIDKALEKGCRK